MNIQRLEAGDRFVHTFELSPAVYEGFIKLFQDSNPLHTDESFAQRKGFRSRVMHGNILNGFISFFVGECLPLKNVMLYSQTIEYRRPVYLGDVLELVVDVEAFHESVKVAEMKYRFTNVDRVKVANGRLQIGLLE